MPRKKHSQKNEQLVVSSLKKQVGHSLISKARVKYYAGLGRFKRLLREYRVPSIATLAFLSLILGFAIVRQFERTSLIELINQVSAGEGGYANLLSSDVAQQFTRNESEEPNQQNTSNNSNTQNTDSTQSTSTAFVIDSGEDNSDSPDGNGTVPGGASGGSGNSSTSGGNNTNPPEPFSAEISSFNQGTTSLQCKNPSKPNVNNCSKIYSFSGSIRSLNGPGTVNYSWQSSTSGGNGNGSYSAGSGLSVTTVSKQVTLECKAASNFSILFAVSSPTSTASNTINVNHNCNEI